MAAEWEKPGGHRLRRILYFHLLKGAYTSYRLCCLCSGQGAPVHAGQCNMQMVEGLVYFFRNKGTVRQIFGRNNKGQPTIYAAPFLTHAQLQLGAQIAHIVRIVTEKSGYSSKGWVWEPPPASVSGVFIDTRDKVQIKPSQLLPCRKGQFLAFPLALASCPEGERLD